MVKIPAYTVTDSDDPEQPEIEHLGNCPTCGALVDMRDWPGSSRTCTARYHSI
jgi:hypothetical protein